ncbi:protein bax [Citrobacter sp. JGM124]|uniref:protein bax n=1 Tax=Citrobacter sp. JGM124 TaxID=2799789 RepID=UPI001BA640F3|nr:protein bax [Citrobacter sp. JGM124]MBS0848077.1 protein bax [Citrobacter sp. JGM124]
MITTLIKQLGAAIFLLLTVGFYNQVIASQSVTKAHNTALIQKVKSSKTAHSTKEYSRKSENGSLPDLRKYPSGTPRKKAFLRAVMPYIAQQNAVITADRNWLMTKRYTGRFSPKEIVRLKDISRRYKVAWKGNTKHIPWNTLLERVDIIPAKMAATMAAAESGWGTSKLARSNNNLFGMKCSRKHCNSQPGKVKGYLHYGSLKEGVNSYVTNLNTHPAYASFRKSRAQLRQTSQEVNASNMIRKLEGYSQKGSRYNNYLFAMYQSNQNLMSTY